MVVPITAFFTSDLSIRLLYSLAVLNESLECTRFEAVETDIGPTYLMLMALMTDALRNFMTQGAVELEEHVVASSTPQYASNLLLLAIREVDALVVPLKVRGTFPYPEVVLFNR